MANFVGSGTAGGQGARTQVVCSKCGKSTTVPFVPTPGRPVFCRECFSSAPAAGGGAGGSRGGGEYRGPRSPIAAPSNARQRMMAQGRKGHFMHDAKALLGRLEGGMEDQHVRAFLEGLFARGARQGTEAAKEFIQEKVTDTTITASQGEQLAQLVERYSFWR